MSATAATPQPANSLAALKDRLNTLPETEQCEVLRVTICQLWLGHEDMRGAIADKLAHVLNAHRYLTQKG